MRALRYSAQVCRGMPWVSLGAEELAIAVQLHTMGLTWLAFGNNARLSHAGLEELAKFDDEDAC